MNQSTQKGVTMYSIIRKNDPIYIPPMELGTGYHEAVERVTKATFEGTMDDRKFLTVVTLNVDPVEEGRVVHGDGGVYQKVDYDALVFKPYLHELVRGYVSQVIEYGAFIRIGPLDALLHISQIMDDKVNVDIGSQRLIGKETKQELGIGDEVIARIVTIKFNERIPSESQIGLTMRQDGLGKVDWLDRKREAKTATKDGEEETKPKSKKKKKGKK
jgi:DNA-directed RNA polymerase subunit E'